MSQSLGELEHAGKSHTSEILSGKRKVSNRQAALVGRRFKIAPSAFVSFA
jgi:antitoxin component HigA of HigAB toxin-antitoxin module